MSAGLRQCTNCGRVWTPKSDVAASSVKCPDCGKGADDQRAVVTGITGPALVPRAGRGERPRSFPQ